MDPSKRITSDGLHHSYLREDINAKTTGLQFYASVDFTHYTNRTLHNLNHLFHATALSHHRPAELCMLSNNIHDYHIVSQGKTTIPSVDDGEEMLGTEVRIGRNWTLIAECCFCCCPFANITRNPDPLLISPEYTLSYQVFITRIYLWNPYILNRSDWTELTMLSTRISDYPTITQGKTRIPGVNDAEELESLDVSLSYRVFPLVNYLLVHSHTDRPNFLVQTNANCKRHTNQSPLLY